MCVDSGAPSQTNSLSGRRPWDSHCKQAPLVTPHSLRENHKTRLSGIRVLSALFCQHLARNLEQPNPQKVLTLNMNPRNLIFFLLWKNSKHRQKWRDGVISPQVPSIQIEQLPAHSCFLFHTLTVPPDHFEANPDIMSHPLITSGCVSKIEKDSLFVKYDHNTKITPKNRVVP